MKKIHQKGFGIVELLLVFVLVGLVGGIGFYVFNQSKKNDETVQPQINTIQNETIGENNPAQEKSTLKYINKDPSFSFEYPENWSVQERKHEFNSGTYVLIASPDYEINGKNKVCEEAVRGIQITVSHDTQSSDPEEITKILNGTHAGQKNGWGIVNASESEMSKQKAARFFYSNGECGYLLRTLAHIRGKNFSVSSSAGDTRDGSKLIKKFMVEYDDIVSSFKSPAE